MPFWNPLIGGKKVLEIEFNEPTTGQTSINLATYVSTNNPSGNPNDAYDVIKVTIPSNYIIGSPSPGTAALTVGSWQPYQDVIFETLSVGDETPTQLTLYLNNRKRVGDKTPTKT